MSRPLTDDEKALLKRILGYATNYEDDGPGGEGWHSPQMVADLRNAAMLMPMLEHKGGDA